MQIASIEEMAEKDLAKRRLKLGDYGLTSLSQDQMSDILGYRQFTKAPYGIGIMYPNGQIGNIRMGSPFVGSKYISTGLAGGTTWFAGTPEADEVIITEGEFKGMCLDQSAKLEGLELLCIGIFGVTGWSGKSERRYISGHLSDLVRGKSVTIIFDYDGDDVNAEVFTAMPKPEVMSAELKLCATLVALGCKVYTIRIGRYSNLERREKYAVDDYLLGGGKISTLLKSRQKYKFEPSGHDTTAEEAKAFALTGYGVYQGNYVRLRDGLLLSRQNALNTWTRDVGVYTVEERTVRPLVSIVDSPKLSVIEQWIYEPSEPYGLRSNGRFNMWKGWGVGVPGDVDLWTELCDRVLPSAEREFFHDWVAYLVQNPGQKNFTYIAMVSPQNGVGKSLLAESVLEMMSPCASVFDAERLFSKNNELLEGQALVVVNELSSDKAKHVNEFKAMVTGQTITLEEKYKAARTVPNITNFIITTNELTPLLVSGENRRDVIIRVNNQDDAGKLWIKNRARSLWAWLQQGGTRVLQHWYEQRDISGYDSKSPAPKFEGFYTAVEASKSNNQMAADDVIMFIESYGEPLLLTLDAIMILSGTDKHNAGQVKRLLMKHQAFSGTRVANPPGQAAVKCSVFNCIFEELTNKRQILQNSQEAIAKHVGLMK